MEKIKVLMVKPREDAYITEIEHTLQSLQEIVGGYIEAISPFNDNVSIICNEEGKLNDSEANRALRNNNGCVIDILYGTFFICRVDEHGEMKNLTDKQIERYERIFKKPEKFPEKMLQRFK